MALELQGELNRLAGTFGFGVNWAASLWAEVPAEQFPMEMIAALNYKAGNTMTSPAPNDWKMLDGVCNQLAGTNGLAAPGALSTIAGP